MRMHRRHSFYAFVLIFSVGGVLLLTQHLWHARPVGPPRVPPSSPYQQSLCSDKATARGPNQRIVSFNFFGSATYRRPHFFGIAQNAYRLPETYPNWTMRLYHSVRADAFIWPTLQAMEQLYPHLDLCNASALPVLGDVRGPQPAMWRFLPLGDPLVLEFVSRDLDTFPLQRELAAVAEWLTSQLPFHVMRDTVHHDPEMLAGMWGAKRYLDPELMDVLFVKLYGAMYREDPPWFDQGALKELVWPLIKGKVMQHDSYFCERFRDHGNMRPFPVRRQPGDNNWVGFRETLDNKFPDVCPTECRPRDHQEWTSC